MRIVHTRDTMSDSYLDSVKIRQEVFVQEQGVPLNLEIDKNEADCIHCVLYSDTNEAIATCRLLPLSTSHLKLQRMAVRKKFRGQNFGQQLIENVEYFAKQQGYNFLKLGAQISALGFYKTLGFIVDGPNYVEATIEHSPMVKRL